jgi:hypothetical protein
MKTTAYQAMMFARAAQRRKYTDHLAEVALWL